MNITRRNALLSTLFGAGCIGLRALATGLPASFLLNPRKAFADPNPPSCGNKDKAQFVILSTSGSGDPINANVPGTYDDPNVYHSPDPAMAKTAIKMGAQSSQAAAPWAALPQSVLDRTTFWHLMTNTPVHPKEPNVLALMGAIAPAEMFPSLLAKHLAPCLNTIQTQPITVGASGPTEGLSFDGGALPIIPPLALKATLANPTGPLGNLQALRDQTLAGLADLYKNGASAAQRAYVDALVTSQSEVRHINQALLANLDSITDNSIDAQILAALTLVQLKVTPVVAIHIPFGGDNHHDAGLATEVAETQSGVAAIGSLMKQVEDAKLGDQVTFLSLNVFGRTLGPASTNGRQHNPNHQVSITIGKGFKPGVVGGLTPSSGDFGALPIDSKSGKGAKGGDIDTVDTLASFGKTVLAGVGVDEKDIDYNIMSGKVIAGALA